MRSHTAPEGNAMSKPNAKTAPRHARLLLASCAIGLALGAAARAPQARAQSFDGTVISAINASVTTAPGTTRVAVTAPRAVINWQPNDTSASTAPIQFQAAPASATDGAFFTSTADYTVLNRILPTGAATGRAISLNGRVVGEIGDGSSPAVTGGDIWFYSPGGIAIGANATFDVGSLLLSTLDVTDADLLDGNSSYSFDGALDSTAMIDVSSGATINALNESSYIAMIAPRVSQAGNVNVNGSATYVGAEQVTIDMAGGLFAIDITRGTTINTPIAHLGTTTGPASTGGADTHTITMVAVPRNDAITLLVGGNLGYAAAGAGIVNGTVQIYAGYDIPNGSTAVADNGGLAADIALGGTSAGAVALSSDLTARASRDIIAASDASGAFFSTSNVTLLADRNASLTANNGFTVLGNLSVLGNRAGLAGQARVATGSDGAFTGILDVSGDLLIDAQGFGAAGGGPGTGGIAEFLVTMGGASIGGQTRILANGFGGPGGGDGVGGTARLSITGAAADLGNVTISADGLGNGNANNPVLNGGDGIGGTAELVQGGGDLLAGLIMLSANGTGGENDVSLPGGSGGNGAGGTVRFVRNGGDFVTSGLIMSAAGSGGAATATGGDATSGDALVALTATTTTLPALSLDISATGGGATNGTNGSATGTGHAARLLVSGVGTQLDITSGLNAIADATLAGNFSTGSDLAAAGIQIEAQTGASITIDGFSNIRANATAFNINQQSGAARGGSVSIGAAGGTIDFAASAFITANAEAGDALASGGSATGGTVTLFAYGGGALSFAASTNIEANAVGGRGDVGSNGTGGTILAFAEDGTLSFGAPMIMSASGTAGFNVSGSNPGTGTGGSVTIESRATAANLSSITLADLNASAVGLGVEDIDGVIPTSGDAGMAAGGNVAVNVGGGTFTAASLTLDASATGAVAAPTAGGPASTGGDALGGTAGFTLAGGTATIGTLLIDARGQGGDAADSLDLAVGALAGAGTAGTARLAVTGGTFDVASVTLDARGLGGDGTSSSTGGSSAGGVGRGGGAILDLDYDPVIPTLSIDASGIGGAGGGGPIGSAGGDGFGGAGIGGAYLDLVAGALTVNNATIRSDGTGGNGGNGRTGSGGNGGSGFGGDARITVSGTGAELTLSPDSSAHEASVTAYGVGGNAGTGAIDATGAGSDGADGGNGLGGNAGFVIADGGRVLAGPNLAFAADGIGGNAADGVSGTSGGAGGDGGAGTGGTANFTINGGALLPFDSAFALDWTINANGLGGVGGLGGDGSSGAGGNGGNGGAGRGGIARIDATDAIFELGSIFLDAEGFGGSGQFGAAGAAAGLGGDGFGGTAGFSNGDDGTAAPAGARNITFLDLRADGTGGLVADSPSGLGYAGRIELTAAAGGRAQIGTLAAASRGLTGTTGAGFYLTSTGGTLGVTGDATIDTGAVANFTFDGDGRFAVGSNLIVSALGDITVTHANQPGAPVNSISAAAIDITTPGNLSADAASILRGAATIDIDAGGTILLGNAFARDRITAHAGGDLTLDTLSVSAGNAVLEAANGAVSVSTDAAVTGTVTARGRSVTLNALGDLSVLEGEATAGDLTLTAGGTLAAATASASGAITLTGASVALGSADAGTTLGVTAQGTASFTGLADAQAVTIRSADIVISGALGSANRTATIDLTNSDATRRTFIGGADNASGYSLSADEVGRLFANDIALSAPRVAGLSGASVGSARAPDVIVGGFTLSGRAGAASGNLGTGAFRIATPGKLRVTGAVRLTGLAATNRLEIAADEALEVDAASGSIDLRDTAGGLAGTLALSSDDIIAASLQAIADVGAATATDAIDDRLGVNDGAVNEDGYLRADRIEVNARNGFYVQNSGASDDFANRRGFTVGAGGMDIGTGSAASRIVINGRQSDGAGGFVTGVDLIDLVRVNGQTGRAVTGIDNRSTINGCVIADPLLCGGFFVPETPLSREIFEVPVNPESGEDAMIQLFPLTLIELKDFEPFGFEPLIDEPVTGAGNEDLWLPECDPLLERCDN